MDRAKKTPFKARYIFPASHSQFDVELPFFSLDRVVSCIRCSKIAIVTMFFIYHVLLFTAGFVQAAPQKVRHSSPQPKPKRCNVDLAWEGKQEAVSGRALQGSKIDCRKGFYVTGRWNDPSKSVLTSSLFID